MKKLILFTLLSATFGSVYSAAVSGRKESIRAAMKEQDRFITEALARKGLTWSKPPKPAFDIWDRWRGHFYSLVPSSWNTSFSDRLAYGDARQNGEMSLEEEKLYIFDLLDFDVEFSYIRYMFSNDENMKRALNEQLYRLSQAQNLAQVKAAGQALRSLIEGAHHREYAALTEALQDPGVATGYNPLEYAVYGRNYLFGSPLPHTIMDLYVD